MCNHCMAPEFFENAAKQEIAGTENPAIFGCFKKWSQIVIEFDVLFSSLFF